ncbi:hypothetical protein AK830_g10661, partial [Neonectria ditissima]
MSAYGAYNSSLPRGPRRSPDLDCYPSAVSMSKVVPTMNRSLLGIRVLFHPRKFMFGSATVAASKIWFCSTLLVFTATTIGVAHARFTPDILVRLTLSTSVFLELLGMGTATRYPSLATVDSPAYEWSDEFLNRQPQAYQGQNRPYVRARSNTQSVRGSGIGRGSAPSTVRELIRAFLSVSGDPDMPNGPSIYQKQRLEAFCSAADSLETLEEGLAPCVTRPLALLDDRCPNLSSSHAQQARAGIRRATVNPLTSTASYEQAQFLAEFFYKYLGSQTSLGIHRPPKGVARFALEFHLQFCVWKEEEELQEDTRRKQGGEPFRRAHRLRYLESQEHDQSFSANIYEAQISCLVTGLDHDSWVAYLFIDTYYQGKKSHESVEHYGSQQDFRQDPLTAGTGDADIPTWTPREYFLPVYEARLGQMKHATHNIIASLLGKLEPYMQDSMHSIPLSTDDNTLSFTRKKQIQQMLNEAIRLLRQTTCSISNAIEAWDRFSSRDAAYLSDILKPKGSASQDDIPPFRVVALIEDHINGLRELQRRAEEQQGLCKGLVRELEMQLVMEDNEITAQQHETGELLKILTVIGLLFLPFTATTSLFSMQPGVLPAKAYSGSFIHPGFDPLLLSLLGFLYFLVASYARGILLTAAVAHACIATTTASNHEDNLGHSQGRLDSAATTPTRGPRLYTAHPPALRRGRAPRPAQLGARRRAARAAGAGPAAQHLGHAEAHDARRRRPGLHLGQQVRRARAARDG